MASTSPEAASARGLDARCHAAPSVSVVICAYSDRRWAALKDAVGSVANQVRPAAEIIVVIDNNAALLGQARTAFGERISLSANQGERGLSGARNTGTALATGEIVAFLDDDAAAQPGWLSELVGTYEDDGVVGTGGLVEPRWASTSPPRWLPPEFYWTVGCSYEGLPTSTAAIRNPIGANMSFRRSAILRVGGFRTGVGRLETLPLGCEETEMSVRIGSEFPRSRIVHVPSARVTHRVEAERTRPRYFLRRCWAEGISKAIVTRHVGQSAALATERQYALRTLPIGVLRGFRDGFRGDFSGFARAGAILAGLTMTSAGYAYGQLIRARGNPLATLGTDGAS
jgi:glycosyltransferase involved in cell wall biosynthesis